VKKGAKSRSSILILTMAPQKQVPSPPAVYTPTQASPQESQQSPNTNEDNNDNNDHEAKLKAEARAYALSGGKRKAGSPNTNASASTSTNASPPSTQGIVPQQLELLPPSDRPEKSAKIAVVVAETSDDDDYERFVKSLGLLDDPVLLLEDDEDFLWEDYEDDDEDDEDDDDDNDDDGSVERKPLSHIVESTPTLSSPLSATPLVALPEWEPDFYKDLEEELGSLLEEDLEAAVTTLLTSKSSKPNANTNNPTTPKTNKDTSSTGGTPSPPTSASSTKSSTKDSNTINTATNTTKGGKTSIPQESPATPLREAARQSARTQVTYQQSQQLRKLMTKHYQLLMQQGILAVRAAQLHKLQKNDKSDTFLSGETSDDLAEILDGAVGMLEDLDQVRYCYSL
jgi:hypothetical protein